MRPLLGIVGFGHAAHLGGALQRAAREIEIPVRFFDMVDAEGEYRLLRSLSWRLNDRRPARMARFMRTIVSDLRSSPVKLLITTGAAPLSARTLRAIQGLGIVVVNFSSDDPWNEGLKARWFLEALRCYDHVFTPRRSNLADLTGIGCHSIHYLPFGYDPQSLEEVEPTRGRELVDSLLFVGGGDEDRRRFMAALQTAGIDPTLVGAYWDRWPETRARALGILKPEEVTWLTRRAPVNLVMVRRANRDGHVMRSIEAAAAGGCLLVEDTDEHRDLFGRDGESVRYFRGANEAASRYRELLDDEAERLRLRVSVQQRMASGAHRYSDRLRTIVETALPGSLEASEWRP